MDTYKFTPSCIYNCDETGMTTVPNKPSRILSRKGKKQIGSLSFAARGLRSLLKYAVIQLDSLYPVNCVSTC
jgi:hypothetical protein